MKRTTITSYDDLDYAAHGTATPADTEIRLILGDKAVDLDLTTAHAEELAKLLAPWLDAGRPAPKRPPGYRVRPAPSQRKDPRAKQRRDAIRAWANKRYEETGDGIWMVAGLGRISGYIVEAYDAEQAKGRA